MYLYFKGDGNNVIYLGKFERKVTNIEEVSDIGLQISPYLEIRNVLSIDVEDPPCFGEGLICFDLGFYYYSAKIADQQSGKSLQLTYSPKYSGFEYSREIYRIK